MRQAGRVFHLWLVLLLVAVACGGDDAPQGFGGEITPETCPPFSVDDLNGPGRARNADGTCRTAPRPPVDLSPMKDVRLPDGLPCEVQLVEVAGFLPDSQGVATAEEAVSQKVDGYGEHYQFSPEGFAKWDEQAGATDETHTERYLVRSHETDQPVAIITVTNMGDRGYFVTEVRKCAEGQG